MLSRLRTIAACNPIIYSSFMYLFRRSDFWYFPNKDTELFIAAYPRSGNDYAKQLAKCFFPGLRISSHFHRPGAFHYALKINVPVIAVIREPLGCISSCMVKRRSELSLSSFPLYPMNEYLVYHKELLSVVDRVPIVTFEKLIEDGQSFVHKVGQLVDRGAEDLLMQQANEQVRAKLEDPSSQANQVPDTAKGPNEKKEALKRDALNLIQSDKNFITEATQLYRELASHA